MNTSEKRQKAFERVKIPNWWSPNKKGGSPKRYDLAQVDNVQSKTYSRKVYELKTLFMIIQSAWAK